MRRYLVILTSLVALATAQLSALSYDFNVGVLGGIQTPIRDTPGLPVEALGGIVVPKDGASHNNFAWSVGGFIGGGVSFDSFVPSAAGFEYTGAYVQNRESFTLGAPVPAPLASQEMRVDSFQNFFDGYYKLSLMQGAFPIDLQMNLGAVLRLTTAGYVNDKKVPGTTPPMGLGLHVGLRANFHVFFLGMDYAYIPSYNVPSTGNNLSPKVSGYAANSVGVTMGVMLNKNILDSLLQG